MIKLCAQVVSTNWPRRGMPKGRGIENMCQLLFSSHYYGLLGCYFGYERDIKHFVVLLRFVYVISLSIGCFGLTTT